MNRVRIRCFTALALASAPAAAQQCFASTIARTGVTILYGAGGDPIQDDLRGEVVLDGSEAPQAKAVIGRWIGSRGDGTQRLELRPATFRLEGGRHTTLTLILPKDGTCAVAGPGTPMPATGFHVSEAAPPVAAPQDGMHPGGDRVRTLEIDASLDIPLGKPAATYLGHYPLTLACD